MKFCYLVPDLGIPVDGQKGASSHIRGFVNALKDLGHEVLIVTSKPVKEGTIDVPIYVIEQPNLIQGILKEQEPRTFRALRHLMYNTAVEKILQKIVQTEKPDVIYERYSPFSFAGSFFSKQRGIPHILEVNAPLAEQGKIYRKQALNEAADLLELTAFHHSSLIITLTHQLKEWLVSLGVAEDKVHVRPCGVDAERFHPNGPNFSHQYVDKVVLGFVGSLKPWHDLEMLAKIFPLLAQDPRFHLLVVGDGPSRKIVQAIKDRYPERVTVTGAVIQEEVPHYIRTMDIALSPYPNLDLFYFSPLKVYEYMAVGKPIIATGIGQLNELIQNGENGLLVPPNQPQAWVDAIRYLVDHPHQGKAMGALAREQVELEHTWEKRGKTFLNIVNECIFERELATL